MTAKQIVWTPVDEGKYEASLSVLEIYRDAHMSTRIEQNWSGEETNVVWLPPGLQVCQSTEVETMASKKIWTPLKNGRYAGSDPQQGTWVVGDNRLTLELHGYSFNTPLPQGYRLCQSTETEAAPGVPAIPAEVAAIIRTALRQHEDALRAFYDAEPKALANADLCKVALKWLAEMGEG